MGIFFGIIATYTALCENKYSLTPIVTFSYVQNIYISRNNLSTYTKSNVSMLNVIFKYIHTPELNV